MSKVHMLRALVEQRLTLAAEEIFELFERTMVEYEEELCRQRKLLNAVFQPEVRLHRTDVQQLMVNREVVLPEHQIWNPSLDQQNPPELPNIKVEQEELWTKQEEEQLQLLEEIDITKFTFTPVKTEDKGEKPQISLLHQSQTEELRDAEHLKSDADEEHSGRSEAARNLNPDNHLETATNDKTSHFPEPETEDCSYDCKDTGGPQSDLNFLQNSQVLVSEKGFNTGETSTDSSECAANFDQDGNLQVHSIVQPEGKSFGYCDKKCTLSDSLRGRIGLNSERKHFSCPVCEKCFQWRADIVSHMRVHTGEKPFSCSVCGDKFARSTTLIRHLRIHTGEKPFSCSVCGKNFAHRSTLTEHLRVHTGEKPFSCSLCDKKFARSSALTYHRRVHTGEKPFKCSMCKARFSISSSLYKHIKMHHGEKPFSCSICSKTFDDKWQLRRHVMTHTGEKPISCSVHGKNFSQSLTLTYHRRVHTGEKPFSCSVCGKKFAHRRSLKRHFNVHTGEKLVHCNVCDKRFTRPQTFKKHKCVGDNSRNK